jgi:hypothetical protein
MDWSSQLRGMETKLRHLPAISGLCGEFLVFIGSLWVLAGYLRVSELRKQGNSAENDE